MIETFAQVLLLLDHTFPERVRLHWGNSDFWPRCFSSPACSSHTALWSSLLQTTVRHFNYSPDSVFLPACMFSKKSEDGEESDVCYVSTQQTRRAVCMHGCRLCVCHVCMSRTFQHWHVYWGTTHTYRTRAKAVKYPATSVSTCMHTHTHTHACTHTQSLESHRNVPGNVLYFALSASPTHIVYVCQ